MAKQGYADVVGPEGHRTKYQIVERVHEPAPGISVFDARVEVGGLRHEVLLWSADASLWDADAWLSAVESQRHLDHHGLGVVRETFRDTPNGADTAFVALNRTGGETLDEWLEARPDRDAIGSLSLLIPVAAAIDAFHSGGGEAGGFDPLRPADIVVRSDQTAVLARPPSPSARPGAPGFTDNPFAAPERSDGTEPSDSVAADAYGFGVVAASILGAKEFTPVPALVVEQVAARTESLPDVRVGLLRALDLDPALRPRSLVEWLSEMRGATITPFTDLAPTDDVSPTMAASARSVVDPPSPHSAGSPASPDSSGRGPRILPLLLVPLIALAAFALGRSTAPDTRPAEVLSETATAPADMVDNGAESTAEDEGRTDEPAASTEGEEAPETAVEEGESSTVVDPAGCDPEAYAADAAAFIATMSRGFEWTDPDGDCFLTPYEMHWLGTDPFTHNEDNTGAIADADAQITVLLNMREDGAFSRAYNLTSCEPELYASIFADFAKSVDRLVSWRDTDSDCLHDAYELNAVGTDHRDADSDGDGVTDGVDLEAGTGALLTSPASQARFIVDHHRQGYFEGETILESDPVMCDSLTWAAAAESLIEQRSLGVAWVDADGDCLHDDYEVKVLETDPANPDSDGDGELDGVDDDHADGLIEAIDVQVIFVSRDTATS